MELIEVEEFRKKLDKLVEKLTASTITSDQIELLNLVFNTIGYILKEMPKLTVSEVPRKICDNGVMRYMTEEEQKMIEELEEGEENEQHADLGREEVSRSDG